MVGPPDSKNHPTTPAAGTQYDPDLRLEPEADSLSTFVPEHAPLEQSDSVPPPALTQAQPTHDDIPETYIIWPVDDDDRSWWSRLRSLKASLETKILRRSAHHEPVTTDANMPGPTARTDEVTMEAIRNLERHLASLAALRDACASIDRRLARVEEVSRQRDHAPIDQALHDVCSQMSDRLVRVEATVQRAEDTLHRREGIVAERFQEFSASVTARLAETEDTIQRIERERADETLRLTQQSHADLMHELYANIDARLERTEDTLHRREGIVAERFQELSARVTARLAETEDTIQRIARERVDETLRLTQQSHADSMRELYANIDARLERTDDTLHRREGIVTEWLQELSADMTARFAEADEAIQRIERIVSSNTVEQPPSQQPAVRADNPIGQPWTARLAVPALVLLAGIAIGALIGTSRDVAPDKVVPLTTSDQVVTPVEPTTNEGIRAVSTTPVMADTPRPTRESPVSTPQRPDRRSAPTASRSPRFVGTLSITSVPSGASVSINGKPAGVTPLRLRRQRAGSLAVQVAHDGFERWSAAVLVPADQLTQVTAKLRASAR